MAAVALKKDPNKVMVLYDPNDPQKARVNNFGNLYMLPLVLFVIGLFVILFTIPGFEDFLRRLTAFWIKSRSDPCPQKPSAWSPLS